MDREQLTERLHETLAGLEIGRAQACRNLTVFPLTAASGPDAGSGAGPGYMSLEEAISEGHFRISELSESGSVPELLATNDGTKPVLLVDGEQLVGAKQNRIVNISILVAAQSSLTIPVACVEAGRWSHGASTMSFDVAEETYFAEGRRQKARQVSRSMAGGRGRRADQGMVWDAVDAKSARLSAHSPTADVREAYRRHRGSIEDYVSAISVASDQCGALFAIDGEPVGVELFDHSAPFAEIFPRLVRSYAMDAIETERPAEAVPEVARARDLIEAVSAAGANSYPAVGLGEDIRLESDQIDGGALVHEGRFVHLCAFRERARAGRAEGAGPNVTIQRASERRRRRRRQRTLH